MKELKTFFIRTYGCQMNELDSEILVGQLESRGLKRTDQEDLADILIFNTCSIRDLAERKVMGKLGQLGRGKKRDKMIGITGCMAVAKKDSLFRKFPHLDFVLGTNNLMDVNSAIDEVIETKKQILKIDDRYEENLDYLLAKREDKLKAFISIIRGCDKFCTYCVVPYTRGQEVSRHPDSIVKECKKLVEQGYREVTLLGQNVNSYGKDEPSWKCLFPDLLEKLDRIDGLYRVRFMTSHPIDISIDLMYAIRDFPSLTEFVHFPIQSGSSRILRKMNRIYTKEQYLEKVTLLKKIVKNVSLGSDFIVGFPTETEVEFQETFDVFKEVRYSVAFIYAYSPRKGTPAMRWKDDISEEIKQERLQRLMQLSYEISQEHQQALLNTDQEVLIERLNQDGKTLRGRTRCWKKIILEGPKELIGSLQQVKVHGFSHQTLLGSLQEELATASV